MINTQKLILCNVKHVVSINAMIGVYISMHTHTNTHTHTHTHTYTHA